MHPQGVSDEQQMAQLHLAAALHALDRRPVDAALMSQGFLGEIQVQPSHADAVADGSAGVENPRGLFGRHPTNRLRTMIISQQQF